jgi:PPOX class probable F420-dependent enzyme
MTYQAVEMSQAQVDEFLQEPRFAVIGTIRSKGAPQLTPVWYLHENGHLYVSISTNSAKCRNLARDRRVCICIAAQHPDARAVIIYGTVELISEKSAWFDDIHWRITRRYCSSDEETRDYLDSFSNDAQTALIVITPDKVIAENWN